MKNFNTLRNKLPQGNIEKTKFKTELMLSEYREIHRASGNCICEDCGKEYKKHPYDPNELSGIDQLPFLRIACDGRLLKL